MIDYDFRVWHKERKVYLDFDAIDFKEKRIVIMGNEKWSVTTYIPFKDVVLEPYTGVKDKNNTKVYTGDIINDIDYVYYSPNMCAFMIACGNDIEESEFLYDFYFDEIEVTGNIHNDISPTTEDIIERLEYSIGVLKTKIHECHLFLFGNLDNVTDAEKEYWSNLLDINTKILKELTKELENVKNERA